MAKSIVTILGICVLMPLMTCNKGVNNSGNQNLPAAGQYVVLAWNDLGMHCLNPTYDTAVILPPYNNLRVQVIRKGAKPAITITGVTVEYKITNNTYSYGKRDFGQFWDNVKKLFGADLEKNKGLNLVDADVHNGLTGSMIAKGDHFEADGIPVTPVDDSDVWNPYQKAEITIKDANGKVIAQTQTTIPTSDEINCSKCHGTSPFADILQKHDTMHSTNLEANKPVLCAGCHGSPALGGKTPGVKYLSQAIHSSHASRSAVCYDCHPGAQTKCNRSLAHTTSDGNCTTCHGEMSQVGGSIASGDRIPWVNEPKCATCHINVPEVDTGALLYRNSMGHGGLYCAGCHSSPHAMIPSREASDNYTAVKYQGKAKTIGSCGVCHEGSKGGSTDLGDFTDEHGGNNPGRTTACNVCHTSVSTTRSKWPHAYGWKNR
jgi:hypothetical protein